MRRKSIIFPSCLAVILAIGCGKSAEDKQKEEAIKQAPEATEAMSEAAEGGAESMGEALTKMQQALGGGEGAEPVDFRELKSLLPENVPGMKRVNATGEKSGAFGVKVSYAEADYESEDGNTLSVKITDMGSLQGLTAMATYGWAMADIDRETETGYEKSVVYKGHKAFEKFDNSDQHGEIHVLVASRFVVEVTGYQVRMGDIKAALDRVDLGKLEGMRTEGAK